MRLERNPPNSIAHLTNLFGVSTIGHLRYDASGDLVSALSILFRLKIPILLTINLPALQPFAGYREIMIPRGGWSPSPELQQQIVELNDKRSSNMAYRN